MNKSYHILEGSIIKPLLYFFFPILLGTFFQQFYNTIDALIVGNILGKEALAAVGGTTSTYLNLYIGFFVGISCGASVLISQYFGSHDDKRISICVHTSMLLSIVIGLILTVIGIVTARSSLIFLGIPDAILEYSLTYIYIYFIGFVVMLIYNMGCSILRAVGDSKRPLYYLIVSCIINVILDILFVQYLSFGISGAALATILAQIVAMCMVVYSLMNNKTALKFYISHMKMDFKMSSKIIRIGLPAAVQSMMYTLSNLVIASAINAYGVDTIAANTAYGKIDSIFWMVVQAFGIAMTTFVGQNYGAKKIDRVKRGIHLWLAFGMAVSVILAFIIYIYAIPLLGIFNSDQNVISIGMQILLLLTPYWCIYVPIEILSGALRGMGITFIPTIITALGIVGVRILWVIFVDLQNYQTLFMIYPLSWLLTSIAFLIYYFSGLYKKQLD